ncbi:hypothetical protein ABIB94_003836 [Bradyrhizobium sp. JR7.2]
MTRVLLTAGLLLAALIVPAAAQPTVLTQAQVSALIKEYECYAGSIFAAQAVLLQKWFKSVGASDQEFNDFKANAEQARRLACGAPPGNYVPSPLNGIAARFGRANGLTRTEPRLALLESLARYAKLLESSCNLQTNRRLGTSLLAKVRSMAGGAAGASSPPPPFNASDFLGSCKSGGGAQVPNPGQDIGSLGTSAQDVYRQCVKDVIAKAKPAECVTNPYAGQTEDEFERNFGWAGVGLTVAGLFLGGPVGAVVVGAGIFSGAVSFAADQAGDEEDKRVAEAAAARAAAATAEADAAAAAAAAKAAAAAAEAAELKAQIEQLAKEMEEIKKKLAKAEADAAARRSGSPTPAPKPSERCNRFSVSGTSEKLDYKRDDGGVIGILDSIKACRCKARALESPSGTRITEPDGSACQSDADRERSECARNPYGPNDRPREECIKYLMEDNKSFNIEARLCSAVRCNNYQPGVGLGANRVLGCGCIGSRIEGGPGLTATRTTRCDQMRCDGNCVCRGTQCACEGSELRGPPGGGPPAPPVRPAVPEGPPGVRPPPIQ